MGPHEGVARKEMTLGEESSQITAKQDSKWMGRACWMCDLRRDDLGGCGNGGATFLDGMAYSEDMVLVLHCMLRRHDVLEGCGVLGRSGVGGMMC